MFLDGQWRQAALRMLRTAFSRFVQGSAGKARLEVERKFRISADEAASLPVHLQNLGFEYAGTATMTDAFLIGLKL
jgi:hypothetical protein